ncbi:MAG: M23 family metallopeptidase [Crocinitomicaceae bacterium]
MKKSVIIFVLIITGCSSKEKNIPINKNQISHQVNFDTIQFTSGFDFPVGKPDAVGYYNAQEFTENDHLGEDWNGIQGGNTDLGDPIYSIANGYVSFAKNIGGGWGNVIRIIHYINPNKEVESLYAHCDEIFVEEGEFVHKGIQIGTIGNNNDMYLAHLHFEIRDNLDLPVGGGYSTNTSGYINPTEFIMNNR